jgi:hypothetical protein
VQYMCGPSDYLCLVDVPSVYGEYTLHDEDMSVYSEFTLFRIPDDGQSAESQ